MMLLITTQFVLLISAVSMSKPGFVVKSVVYGAIPPKANKATGSVINDAQDVYSEYCDSDRTKANECTDLCEECQQIKGACISVENLLQEAHIVCMEIADKYYEFSKTFAEDIFFQTFRVLFFSVFCTALVIMCYIDMYY